MKEFDALILVKTYEKSIDFKRRVTFDIPSSIDVQPMETRQNAYASNGKRGIVINCDGEYKRA